MSVTSTVDRVCNLNVVLQTFTNQNIQIANTFGFIKCNLAVYLKLVYSGIKNIIFKTWGADGLGLIRTVQRQYSSYWLMWQGGFVMYTCTARMEMKNIFSWVAK